MLSVATMKFSAMGTGLQQDEDRYITLSQAFLMISKKIIHFVRSLSRDINRSDHTKIIKTTVNFTHFESLPTVENTKNNNFAERFVKYPSTIFKNALFEKVSNTEISPKKHYQNA